MAQIHLQEWQKAQIEMVEVKGGQTVEMFVRVFGLGGSGWLTALVGMGKVVAGYGKAIEVDSPYYLHPSDHQGLVFVRHPLTENGENYFTWRRNMMTTFE
ncbi:hypothetical protein RJ639_035899 [Escallonia herrerae]|uniref:Retrotransposon Copia-like N-terminal domain-containing protein n=1 Tax=Escallonia herrerae TaxID=1293975 RepID=A0AA88WQV3_9ASTE|nr:hypothetical protein RJ639_035899 [Escallonia herrerae]